jgi:hypothetical protein
MSARDEIEETFDSGGLRRRAERYGTGISVSY